MVKLQDGLAWPIVLEKKEGHPEEENGKIPFTAWHFLRNSGHMDVSATQFDFSVRGRAFFVQVAQQAAENMLDANDCKVAATEEPLAELS